MTFFWDMMLFNLIDRY